MNMLHDVFQNLHGMSLLHLLLAFLACIGYMLADGRIAPPRLRAFAALLAAACTTWFVFDSPQWTASVMLVAMAVGIVGIFSGIVWALSAMLGLARRAPRTADAAAQPAAAVASGAAGAAGAAAAGAGAAGAVPSIGAGAPAQIVLPEPLLRPEALAVAAVAAAAAADHRVPAAHTRPGALHPH